MQGKLSVVIKSLTSSQPNALQPSVKIAAETLPQTDLTLGVISLIKALDVPSIRFA